MNIIEKLLNILDPSINEILLLIIYFIEDVLEISKDCRR